MTATAQVPRALTTSSVRRPRPKQAFRADIQGLRAVAVAAVLLFHLWPDEISGGFVGVDVFFVISGFLITSHLYANPPHDRHDLAAFWSRRVRRLLPASLLVLTVTIVATRLVAPETQWATTAAEVIAAALYVENWQLARTSVDYLAAENAASPVQHFWSMSVEEQFYLMWPVLILVLVALARRTGRAQAAMVGGGLAVVVAASLAFSVYATATEPAGAYFITPTRIWELGVGALLALGTAAWPRRGRFPLSMTGRTVLAWLGLAAIVLTTLMYTDRTPFPGWQASVPVLGTAAVIAALAPPTAGSPVRLLAVRPVQFLGDISYSVYLWHWPLVILVPYVTGQLGWLEKSAILVSTILLGWASKVYVEDRFRFAVQGASALRSFQVAALAMAVVVALGVAQVIEVRQREDAAKADLAQALAAGGACFGAAALAAPRGRCDQSSTGDPVPAPAQAPDDKTEAYERDCFSSAPFQHLKRCEFGDPNGTVSIALVGNSHAGHWLPAVERIAKQKGWKVTTLLASECTTSTTPVVWNAGVKQRGCLRWADRVLRETSSGDFDLIVTSQRNGRPALGFSYADSYPSWLDGYRQVVDGWVRAGTSVVVIHDTATPGATLKSVPDCLAQHPDDYAACSGPRSAWVPRDPLAQAATEATTPRISVVDLNRLLCDKDTCPAVIGGVTVYSDASHLTKTFAGTLAPYLEPALAKAVERVGGR
ncbi:MAG TPA: acyltransferase family protein [Propionibacteriaceae bacterium]|nr:acyltransferase family protein [Propionibacteriaceae bacterium]